MTDVNNGAFRPIRMTRTSRRLLRRTARDLRTPDFLFRDPRVDVAAALARLRVAVVGSGGVGRAFADALARLQPAKIYVVDHDRYSVENLGTQAIQPEEIGCPKATSTGQRLKRIHPGIDVHVYDGPVQSLGDDAFEDCHVVVLATDNLPAETEVSRRCVQHRVPLIHGAVYGDALVAQVQILHNRDRSGPCLVCGYGDLEWAHLSRQTRWSCHGPRLDWQAGAAVSTVQLEAARTRQHESHHSQTVRDRHLMEFRAEINERIEKLEQSRGTVASPPPSGDVPDRRAEPAEQSEPGYPSTAASHINAFAAAVNSGDMGLIRKFINDRYSDAAIEEVEMEQRLGVYRRLFDRSHGIEIHRIDTESPGKSSALARDKASGVWYTYAFEFEPIEPHGIISVLIEPADPDESRKHIG